MKKEKQVEEFAKKISLLPDWKEASIKARKKEIKMKKFKKGDLVEFEIMDNFTGRLTTIWAKVVSKAKDNPRIKNNPEYAEVDDDVYVAYSDELKRSFLISADEILDKK